MNKFLKIILVFLAINIYADEKRHYIGVGGSVTRAGTHTIKSENMVDITVRYGYGVFDFLDLELRGSFYITGGKKLYHPSSIGVFFKPNINISKNTNIYALLGYSKNTLSKQDTSQVYAVTIQNDYSYGGGAEYKLVNDLFGYIDYVQYIDKTVIKKEGKYSIKIDSLSMGVNYKFNIESTNDELPYKNISMIKTYESLLKNKTLISPLPSPVIISNDIKIKEIEKN